jgi:hypothetical protein
LRTRGKKTARRGAETRRPRRIKRLACLTLL